MSRKPKHYFAAVPARALADRRLDGGRYLLLSAIALHARMNAAQGCWASATTLASITGLEHGTVRNYIGDLVRLGYIVRQNRPGTPTQRTLFIVYDDDADLAVLKGVISRNDTLAAKVSSGTPQGVISGNDTKIDSYGVNREDIAQSAASAAERPPADVIDIQKRYSAEAASRPKDATLCVNSHDENGIEIWAAEAQAEHRADARFLRTLQDWLKAGSDRPLTPSEVRAMQNWRSRCWEIWEAYDDSHQGDPIGGWAGRLCEELSAILYDYEQEEVDA